ncbi:hypothetical protein Q3G72_031669 [Acer saccharum]|nr:hypothetical protein Q3G72_031669 [Acer saccharum]
MDIGFFFQGTSASFSIGFRTNERFSDDTLQKIDWDEFISDSNKIIIDHAHYGFWTFNHLGLLVLKKLACTRNHDNCGKIGNTRGLLPKIIDFTPASSEDAGKHNGRQRRTSPERDFREENATERIGGTGGILFFKEATPQNQTHVRITAGEALAMLAMDSKSNCHRILKLKVRDRLVETLEMPLLRVNYARILTNLCSYSGVELIASTKGHKLQEVMIGLAAHVFKFMTPEESSFMFDRAGIKEVELAVKLVEILKKYQQMYIFSRRWRWRKS